MYMYMYVHCRYTWWARTCRWVTSLVSAASSSCGSTCRQSRHPSYWQVTSMPKLTTMKLGTVVEILTLRWPCSVLIRIYITQTFWHIIVHIQCTYRWFIIWRRFLSGLVSLRGVKTTGLEDVWLQHHAPSDLGLTFSSLDEQLSKRVCDACAREPCCSLAAFVRLYASVNYICSHGPRLM